MIDFEGQQYDEAKFPAHALYHLHRLYAVKKALEKTTQDLNRVLAESSSCQVIIEGLMSLEAHSNAIIRKELEALEPVPVNVPGT